MDWKGENGGISLQSRVLGGQGRSVMRVLEGRQKNGVKENVIMFEEMS